MKFPDIPLGARFEFRGNSYIKETPLIARDSATGQKKLMARSAEVTLLDPPASATAAEQTPRIDGDTVQAAFADFFEHCRANVAALANGTATAAEVQEDLDKGRARFLHQLGL